jgi:hypothetical protein
MGGEVVTAILFDGWLPALTHVKKFEKLSQHPSHFISRYVTFFSTQLKTPFQSNNQKNLKIS